VAGERIGAAVADVEARGVVALAVRLSGRLRQQDVLGGQWDGLDAEHLEEGVQREPTRRPLLAALLRKYGYPPDKQERATVLVLQQAEVLSEEWAA
jgi:Domain of unknown function (DUF3387)